MQPRVPVTVLSGFLGSGKTTLLNRLLEAPHGLRVAVVVNEFGAIGIDGHRVAGSQQFVELDNGCLCCALNEDLKRTAVALRERGGFDHLVLETTGLADPLPVAWTFSRPGLLDFYRIDAIVTVVDAANVSRIVEEVPEVSLQIARADLLVLNKLDLVGDDDTAALAVIRRHNDRAPVLRAVRGEVPAQLVLSVDESSRFDALAEPGPGRAHHPSFESWAFRTDRILDDARLEDLLDALPARVYRVKGLVRTDGGPRWTLVNAVAGRFEMEPFEPAPEPLESALVLIGRDLDHADLELRCRALLAASGA